MRLIDYNVRSYLFPVVVLDKEMLRQNLREVQAKREEIISSSNIDAKDLGSNPKFAEVLKSLGVTPPMKISPTTGKPTYAFAKTDWEFLQLAEDPDIRVQAVMAARLNVKSTIEESRTERFLALAEKHTTLQVPLKYYGAHTGRFSGEEKLNLQNLQRGSLLRKAMVAPDGYVFAVADASQIEARVLAALAGETALVTAFRNGTDIYSQFASGVFGREITKVDVPERFVGKTSILGMGFGAGADKSFDTLQTKARQLRIEFDLTRELSDTAHKLYRQSYREIVRLWRRANMWVESMPVLGVNSGGIVYNCLCICRNMVLLPNTLALHFPDLHLDEARHEYVYKRGRATPKLYGAKLVENIVQALARIITLGATPRIEDRAKALGLDCQFIMSIHDELIFVVKEHHAEVLLGVMMDEMRKPPKWMPELPLDAEGGIAKRYGDVK